MNNKRSSPEQRRFSGFQFIPFSVFINAVFRYLVLLLGLWDKTKARHKLTQKSKITEKCSTHGAKSKVRTRDPNARTVQNNARRSKRRSVL